MGLPPDLALEQADGTAWMASYCLNMAWAAVELALGDPAYEDMAVKFLEHYLAIAAAMNGIGGEDSRLWDEEDGFYYDFIRRSDGARIPLKLRSLVGLLPIFPAVALTQSTRQRLREQAPYFAERMRWYGDRHPELASLFPERVHPDGDRRQVFTLYRRTDCVASWRGCSILMSSSATTASGRSAVLPRPPLRTAHPGPGLDGPL